MCLVSYIPTPNGVIMSSNRDEAPSRSTNTLQKERRKTTEINYPADSKGGSWFVLSEDGVCAIVLNGAFKFHKRKENYRLSRGVMLKEIFDYDSPIDFIRDYNFTNIEPFTLVLWTGKSLIELRWNSLLKYLEILDPKKIHVWSSSTLYNEEQVTQRKKLFHSLVSHSKSLDSEIIQDIHLNGKVGNSDFDFVMNREDRVCTVSLTQMIVEKNKLELSYYNLLLDEKQEVKLK